VRYIHSPTEHCTGLSWLTCMAASLSPIIITLACSADTPRPLWECTAKALATHDVIVSGTVVVIKALPLDLKYRAIIY